MLFVSLQRTVDLLLFSMPELAEVEHSRRQWDPALGQPVLEVLIARPDIRVFRNTDTDALRKHLIGQRLLDSEAKGKQMLFRFSGNLWLGIHLGMSGELRREDGPEDAPRKHDHLVLRLAGRSLVFEDKRHFGRVRLHQSSEPPVWWTELPPGVLSEEFTHEKTAKFFDRRQRTPIKGVLLMQEHFLGVGNWMADEILWRAQVHPATPAGALGEAAGRRLWEQTRWVSGTAIRIISDDWTYPPDWLFAHRWEAGGECPRCQTALDRATIGGRTTCWCPQCQPATGIKAPKGKVPVKKAAGKKGVPKTAKTALIKAPAKAVAKRRKTVGSAVSS